MLGVALGTGLQLQQRQLWSAEAYCACLALGTLACMAVGWFSGAWGRMRMRWCSALLLILLVALATAGQIGLRSLAFAERALSPDLEGRDLQVIAVVEAMPQVGERGMRFRARVESAQWRGELVQVPPLMDLSWYWTGLFDDASAPRSALPAIRAGQRWSFEVRLKAPHGGMNPHGFDYELWMWEQGVQATGYVRTGSDGAAPELLGESPWMHPLERARQHVRDAIFEHMAWSPPHGPDAQRQRAVGLVAALVTGDQRAIDRHDWDVFRITGVAHLVSISGLHITMFAWLAGHFIGVLWRRSAMLCLRMPAQVASLWGGVALAALYSLFSGWGVPAQRTVFMLCIVALLRSGGRCWPWPHVWLTACAMVLLWDPWAMLQAGFWLSFVAVGILFASNMRRDGTYAPAPEGMGFRARLGRMAGSHLRQLVHQQWVVTLAIAPLTLLLFGQMSVVGLLVNLLAIPWVTLAVLPVAMGGVLWHALWVPAVWAAQLFTSVLQWFAALPMAQLSMAVAPFWAGTAAVLAGMLLALRLPWRVRLLALPCLLPALWWSNARPAVGVFDLMAMDVGQGQAVLVRTSNHSMLYDAGPLYSPETNAGERVVVPLLKALDEHVDMLVLSHRDADHTGGAAAVLAAQPQARLLASIEGDHPLSLIRPIRPCVAGDEWSWDGVRFRVLHPQAGPATRLASGVGGPLRANTISCVLQINDANGVSALLAGDIEQSQERELLARGVLEPVRLLLVPHHGSKTSSSEAFIDALAPSIAVVQSGYRNRFGHPAPEVVKRYEQRAAAVVATPECGAAHWRSDAPDAVGCERERAARYWQHRVADHGALRSLH